MNAAVARAGGEAWSTQVLRGYITETSQHVAKTPDRACSGGFFQNLRPRTPDEQRVPSSCEMPIANYCQWVVSQSLRSNRRASVPLLSDRATTSQELAISGLFQIEIMQIRGNFNETPNLPSH